MTPRTKQKRPQALFGPGALGFGSGFDSVVRMQSFAVFV